MTLSPSSKTNPVVHDFSIGHSWSTVAPDSLYREARFVQATRLGEIALPLRDETEIREDRPLAEAIAAFSVHGEALLEPGSRLGEMTGAQGHAALVVDGPRHYRGVADLSSDTQRLVVQPVGLR
jgi:hypothetical protein